MLKPTKTITARLITPTTPEEKKQAIELQNIPRGGTIKDEDLRSYVQLHDNVNPAQTWCLSIEQFESQYYSLEIEQ